MGHRTSTGGVPGHAVRARRWAREILERSPWWALSASAHFILLVAATAVGFAVKSGTGCPVPPVGWLPGYVENPSPPVSSRKVLDPRARPVDLTDLRAEATVEEGDDWSDDRGPLEASITGRRDSSYVFPDPLDGRLPAKALPPGPPVLGSGAGGPAMRPHGSGDVAGRKRSRPPLGSAATDDAVRAGLDWLARHQHPDGRWSTARFGESCKGPAACSGPGARDHDVGLTGLAVLAFLGAGHLPGPRTRYGERVLRGLGWLRDRQDGEGCFPRQEGEFLYDHAIATLALTEAAWLTQAGPLRASAQRGVGFVIQAQNPGMAWRYSVRPGDNDTSVSGWCIMALKSAELSGLSFPRQAFDGARRWLDRATSAGGLVGYESPGDAGSTIPGVNDRWRAHPAMTAVGLLSRILIDPRRGDPWHRTAAGAIVRDLPVWDESAKSIDFYYWYYAALALFQYDAPHGAAWRAFEESMKRALLPHQEGEGSGCARGSWSPAPDRWGSIGGRVYATALNALTLEVYYRYENVFTGARR